MLDYSAYPDVVNNILEAADTDLVRTVAAVVQKPCVAVKAIAVEGSGLSSLAETAAAKSLDFRRAHATDSSLVVVTAGNVENSCR